MFSKILFTPSLPRASLSFIFSFSIRHINFVLQFSSAFSTRSVLVPLLKPPIFSYSFSFQILSTIKKLCAPFWHSNHSSPLILTFALNSLLPMVTGLAPDTATHLSKPLCLILPSLSEFPEQHRQEWQHHCINLGCAGNCTCTIRCQFYSFFSLYSLRLWEDKDKSKKGRGMTVTWV